MSNESDNESRPKPGLGNEGRTRRSGAGTGGIPLQEAFANLGASEIVRRAIAAQNSQLNISRVLLAAQTPRFLETARLYASINKHAGITGRASEIAAEMARRQAVIKPTTDIVGQLLASKQFSSKVFANARAIASSFTAIQTLPSFTRMVDEIERRPAFGGFVESLSDSIDSDVRVHPDRLESRFDDLLETDEFKSFVEIVADSGTLDAAMIATAEALEAAGDVEVGDDQEVYLQDDDVAAVRRMLQTFALGHVVVVCVVIGIVSGHFLVALGALAAVSQISGLSIKDLLRIAKDGE